jgi:hypothetical protein
MRKPTYYQSRPQRDYKRLESFKPLLLHPGTWGRFLDDYSALGSHEVLGRD